MRDALDGREPEMKSAKTRIKPRRSAAKDRPSKPRAAYEFRVLFFEHDTSWAAQCLERDIAMQAKTLQDLLYEVERVLVAHFALAEALGLEPFEGIPRAPETFWRLYKNSPVTVGVSKLQFKLDGSSRRLAPPAIRIALRKSA